MYMQKMLSFLVAFFLVLLLREKQKKPFVYSMMVFCIIILYLENEEKTSKKIQRNVFLSI